jgi:hypothetical protein
MTMAVIGLSSSSAQLKMKIWVDKNSYLVREPVFLNYSIENATDSLLFFSFQEIREYFVIKDQNGRFFGPSTRGMYGGGDSLLPHETHTGWTEIMSSYGVTEVGQYSCRLEMPSGGLFPYTGAKSNTIEVIVKEPKGDEHKALQLYLEAQDLHWCKDKDPKKWERAFEKHLHLAETYPKSVYAPISLYTALFRAHVIGDKNIVISVCKKLIEDYPEFYYIGDTFYNLVGNYKVLQDKAGATAYMRELIEKHPNTEISERAEYWLERIEKWEFE